MFKLFSLLSMLLLLTSCAHRPNLVTLPSTEVRPSPYFLMQEQFHALGMNVSGNKEDFDKLLEAKRRGVRWIRLTPSQWSSSLYENQPGSFLIGNDSSYHGLIKDDVLRLLKVLDWAYKLNLKVILSFSSIPGQSYDQNNKKPNLSVWQSTDLQKQAFQFFYDITLNIGSHAALFGFNPISGPAPEDTGTVFSDWYQGDYRAWYDKVRGTTQDLNLFYAQAVKSIRRANAHIPIILDSGFHGHPWAFKVLEPIKDNNIYYSFQWYLPLPYFDDKTQFSYPGLMPLDGVSDYKVYWNKEMLLQFMEPVTSWQKKNNIESSRILVGEFGVASNKTGAIEYIKDCHDLFQKQGFFHAYFDVRGSLANKTEEKFTFRESPQEGLLLDAIGLVRVRFLKPMRAFMADADKGQSAVKSLADEIDHQGLNKLSFDTIILQDGWQEADLSKEGTLAAKKELFPLGLKGLRDELKGKGFALGVSIPMGTRDRTEKRQGTLGFERQNAERIHDANIDVVMLEDGYIDDSEQWDDELLYSTLFEWKKYLNNKTTIIANTGEHRFWFDDFVNISRTARRLRPQKIGGPQFESNRLGEFSTIIRAARRNAKYFLRASSKYINYPGPLSLDGNLNEEEEKSYISLWAIMGSPYFVSADLKSLRAETLGYLMNNDILRIQSDQYESGRLLIDDGEIMLFRKYLSTGEVAYLILNVIDQPLTKEFTNVNLNVPETASISSPGLAKPRVFNQGSLTLQLKPHASELFIIK